MQEEWPACLSARILLTLALAFDETGGEDGDGVAGEGHRIASTSNSFDSRDVCCVTPV
jgi:hypothetical protein